MSDDNETRSTSVRWQYTNDVLAAGVLFAYVLLSALDGIWVVDLAALPTAWRLGLVGIALTAAAWTFGTAAVRAAAKLANR